jgi:hypothetical protein
MAGLVLVVLLAALLFLLVQHDWLPPFLAPLQATLRQLLVWMAVLGALLALVISAFLVVVRRESPLDLLSRFARVARDRGIRLDEPPDFHEVVPANWSIEATLAINADGDAEPEWLVLYRYDKTDSGFGGPVGGVVYDLVPDRVPANLATPMPSRPSAYIPYSLLPRPNGQAYLADRWAQPLVYDVQCDQRDELVIFGYGTFNDRPTRLSIFEWRGPLEGYRLMTGTYGATLYGDAGIQVNRYQVQDRNGRKVDGPIKDVVVWHQLTEPPYYARSQIARRTVYEWTPAITTTACTPWPYFTPTPPPPPPTPLRPTPTFTPTPTLVRTLRAVAETLDFAFGPPEGAKEPRRDVYAVTFPEQAVLAWYGNDRVVELSVPTGDGVGDVVDIVAVVRAQGDPRRLVPVTWRVTKESSGAVRDPVTWRLTPLSPPDP